MLPFSFMQHLIKQRLKTLILSQVIATILEIEIQLTPLSFSHNSFILMNAL